ncbi:putative protein OS=Afipia felis OX=1035 GN=BN961_00174 PE=4 SV=1 [Afipia felis]
MLDKFIDDLKDSAGTAMRLTSLAAAVAVCLFITTGFLCAAAFIAVLDKYGPVYACLAGAAIFFVCAATAAICYALRKRAIRKRPVEAAKSTLQTALSDPLVVATALQAVRIVGVKRMIPLLAVGGIALGLMMKRPPAKE